MHRCVKIFQVYSKCHLSVLSGHFDELLSVTSATKESKQQNKEKTKRKLGHMHTGNTKVSEKIVR